MSIAPTPANGDPFVEALHAACDSDTYGPEWPVPATPAQALAIADFYGADGESGTDADGEMGCAVQALCILAKAYRDVVVDPVDLLLPMPTAKPLDGQFSLIIEEP